MVADSPFLGRLRTRHAAAARRPRACHSQGSAARCRAGMPAADEAPPEEEAPLLGGPKMLVLMLAVFVATQGADTIKMAIGALPDAPLATKDVLSVGGKVHISYCTS